MAIPQLNQLPLDPLEVLRRWPLEHPVAMLHSGRAHDRFARWSLLAEPREWIVGDGLAPLAAVKKPPDLAATGAAVFSPGWIALFAYDLGRSCEPAVQLNSSSANDRIWPDVHLARIDKALVFDHLSGTWSAFGDMRPLIEPLAPSMVADADDFWTGEVRSSLAQDEYRRAVQRVLEYIRAGDVYQVNLARRLSAEFAGSSRALAGRALRSSAPWYGAYLELPADRAVISLSPELFLSVDGDTRRVRTRPIKGTLPASRPARELLRSEKDAAELHMIVDLMRNDLGRVCEMGSVRVTSPRIIESHPTVHHGVAEVEGVLRKEASLDDLLRATFPPGSVTGAPKIRAMQIIDELEPVRRGPYCGSIGFIDDAGNMALNVAIRTMALSGRRTAGRFGHFIHGVLDYGTGGGIVADSIPAREWEETEQKAAVLRQSLRGGETVMPAPA